MISVAQICLWFAVSYFAFIKAAPSSLSRGQFYPTKGASNPIKSEVLQCGSIRDVIKRNTARYRKVLVRNDNHMIDFGLNGDNRYMTSRAKSKLDVLASRVRSKWGSSIKLKVDKAWTDVVDKNDMLSLHYEGRSLKVRLSGGSNINSESNLGQLCGLALAAGFDWVYFESSNYIRISVIPDVCQTKLDLVFVIDGSGSVGVHNFIKVKEFLKNVVDFYNVGLDQTRIGLITYSYRVRIEFYLNRYGSKSQIKSAISRAYYEGSSTATGTALLVMKRYLFSTAGGMRNDKSIPKIGILITDGISNIGYNVKAAANEVKAAGISMFVVGIGSRLNKAELAAVASDPDSEHLFYYGFNDLSAFVDQMSTTSCNEGAQISQCESAETYVDGGSFKYFKGSFNAGTKRVTIELEDKKGKSFLYISTSNKNPGPLDPRGTIKNNGSVSPRASSVDLSSLSNKLVYISVQGQEDQNLFLLSIWDSLFEHDKYHKTVFENGPADQHVANIKSVQSGTFEYTIKAGNSAGNFVINKNNGEVRTKRQLNRESIAKYILVIIAQDVKLRCRKGRTELIINVGDVNDNAPKFDRNPYQFSVSEDKSVTYQVGFVSATDRDIGSNGRLRYTIVSGAGKDDFSMNPSNGRINVARALDFERKANYSLRIRVEDGGNPKKYDMADLIINIVNVDEPPVFTGNCSSGCRASIDEGNVIGRPVKQLSATATKITACQLKFSITSSDRAYFSIGLKSGMITTKSAIDRETKKVYVLRVVVADCANPPLTASVTVFVDVNDINDNAPRFPVAKYTANVNENQRSGTSVTTVKATDLDTVGSARIRYSIIDGNADGKFTINAISGLINTTGPLDREQKGTYQLKVKATDGGTPQMSSSVPVEVIVGDLNDNNPEFKGSKSFPVTENAGRGTMVGQVQVEDKDIGINSRIRCSITGGNFGNAFSIDASTCLITTVGIIDREARDSYRLEIKATDLGNPRRSASAIYTLSIQDENDNSPIFTAAIYRAYIKENSTVGTPVVTVEAKDKDAGNNAKISYSIISGDDSVRKFEINRQSGMIKVKAALSFGARSLYKLKVRAQDGGTTSRTGEAYVLIFIKDTNDFDPVFKPATYSKAVNENVTVGSKVLRVNASDQDTGPSGQLSYTIESGNVGNAFIINSQTGQISVDATLDKETTSSYNLVIKAKDNGSPSKSATARVTITISDVNDNRPKFNKNPFRFQVREDASNQKNIGRIVASDKDTGDNARLTYELIGNGSPISVDANGDVKLIGNIDYERTKSYSYDIKVSDNGVPKLSSYGKLVIEVLDVNDNSPIFGGPYKCEVLENSPTSTTVCYVTATDADSGNNSKLSYTISSATSGTCPFSIQSGTGEIRSTTRLDREQISSYNCIVTAMDSGQPRRSTQKVIEVKVKDENDNVPVSNQTSYSFEIIEEQTSNLSLGNIVANDRDSGNNARLTFTIKAGSGDLGKFQIDSSTGLVSAKTKLDREAQASYSFDVKVSDNGRPSLYVDVKVFVTVKDINDNSPIFGKPHYTGSIRENSAAGSKFVQVKATDADIGSNGNITYEISGGLYKGNFSIEADSGFIKSTSPLDFEQLAMYELFVTAKDGGVPQKSSTVKVTVNIINIDDNAPEFGTTSEVKVSEGAVTGTPVVKFNATDKDGGNLSYSIKNGNIGNAFEIESATGRLKTKAILDRETTALYNLTVSVTDASSKETTAHIPIIITDVNDNAPKFDYNRYTGSIMENKAKDYSILRVRATDEDEGTNSEIVYEIESGTTKNLFKIESNGDIKTTQPLDREMHGTHHLVIAAKDKGTPSLRGTSNVIITVQDENDNTPVFDQVSNKQISENSGIGATVAVIRATDKDSGTNGLIKFSLVSENGSAVTSFEIGESDGVLKTKIDLDREKNDSYSLRIRASDSAALRERRSTETFLLISVLDENDNAPVITSPQSIPAVKENVTVNTVITTFKATDADLGSNAEVEFEIVSGNVGGAFSIDKSSGALSNVKELDRESVPSYQIGITVKDKGKPSLRIVKTFQVDVEDVNDNKPIFTLSKFQGSVDENVPTGTHVVNVSATDADSNDVISYTFSLPSTANIFSINASTGEIKTASRIDYETTKVYRFNVTASDGTFSAEAEVEIEVVNLNDNSPFFENTYNVSISEDIAVSSIFLTVEAKDVDPFGILTYSLVNNTATFSIDSQTGEVKTTLGLDREKISSYVIGVRAEDGGNPKQSTETTISVDVKDVNDNAPYFSITSDKVEIGENTIVNDFYTVTASDKDTGINAELVYEISVGVGSDKFTINPSNGSLSTVVKLGRSSASSYTITILVKDKGNPSLTSQPFVLSISVIDVNDNAPFFIKEYRNETISEGAAVGVEVFQAFANDLDIGSNAEIIYSLGNGNTGNVFEIDNTTGVVSVNGQLDRETLDSYELEVIARDKGTPSLSNSTRASIRVLDVNDNKPEFNKSTLVGQIYENRPVGSSVTTVVATDKDIGRNGKITYSLNANDAFTIDSTTGEVKTLKVLDREEKAQFILNVVATDGGTIPLSTTEELTINVLDVDDNCPVFHPKVYSVTIEENLPRDTIVVNVTAVDKDSGTNAELQYAIKTGDDQGGFSIDPATGSIKISGVVDREYSDKYLLKVRAGKVDCGINKSNDTNIGEGGSGQNTYNHSLAEVHIYVTDKNDNAPIFSKKVFYYDFDNVMTKQLMNFTARDPDLGEGGKVKYRLHSFKRADSYGEQRREIIIEAHDQGSPVLSSKATAVIRNKISCDEMSFQLTESGTLSTTTLCSFKKSPAGSFVRVVGQSFSLDCRAEGNDAISYRWTRDGNSIAEFKNTGILKIDKVTKDDKGTYECLARNGAGTVSAPTKATLVVKERPSIFEHPVGITAEKGGFAAFSCKATGDPLPRFQWRKNGEIYQAGVGYDTNRLVLNDVILNDAGDYYCEAINAFGVAQSNKATLKVVDRGTVLSLTITVDNPKKNGSCHYFVPEKFEKIISSLTKKKLSVTKFDKAKFCNVTACEPNPCENGGKCELTSKSYHCSCKGGWKGKHCLEDIDECKSGIGTCQAGQCQNVNGSYWCKCPLGRAGRNCQYEDSICRSNPCQGNEICLPNLQAAGAKHTCVLKNQKFTTRIKIKKESYWMNYKKFDIENDLTSALQNWKQYNTQTPSSSVDFRSCSIRITNLNDLDNGLVDVEYFILCPVNGSKDITSHSAQLCTVIVNSMDGAKQCKIENGIMVTPKPEKAMPAVEVDIEVVVRENDGSRMLGANEAIDVINQDKVKDKLSSQNFKVSKVTKAYTDKSHTNGEREGTSSVAIAVVLSVLAVLILAAIVGFIIMRRWKGKKKTRKMTMKERTALRAQNKDDLLRSEFNMDNIDHLGVENQGYQIDRDGDLQLEESFMFNVAGHIKKDLYEKTDDEMHEYEVLPGYNGQMNKTEIVTMLEATNTAGSSIAYKQEDDLSLGITSNHETNHLRIKDDHYRSDILMSNMDNMSVENKGFSGNSSSHYTVEKSFMIDVAGQIEKDKYKEEKIEQYDALPLYNGQMNKTEIVTTLEATNRAGSSIAYKQEDDLSLGITSNHETNHLRIKDDHSRSDIMMSNVDNMSVENKGFSGDSISHYPLEGSFMIDVVGQIEKDKYKEEKIEQYEALPLYNVQMNKTEVVTTLEETNRAGSSIAYKQKDNLSLGIKSSHKIIHLRSKDNHSRSDIMMSNVDNMSVENKGFSGDSSSHYPLEGSFMIDVVGQIEKDKYKEEKIEQYEALPLYNVQMNKTEVVTTLEETNRAGSSIAYKQEDDLSLGIKSSHKIIHLRTKNDHSRSDTMMSNVDNLSVENKGFSGDSSSHYTLEKSFMIDVVGQIEKDKYKEEKIEQYEALPLYNGQMNKTEVVTTLEETNRAGSSIAYKQKDDLSLGMKANHETIHLRIKKTPSGGFMAKYGNNEAVSRETLLAIIEHFKGSPLNLDDGNAEVVLSEPLLQPSL